MVASVPEVKTKKKEVILEAIKALGEKASSGAIVKWAGETRGVEITENYVYSVRKNMTTPRPVGRPKSKTKTEFRPVETEETFGHKVIAAAHALVSNAGSTTKAIEAIRYIADERQASENLVALWEERMVRLQAKAEELENGDIDKDEIEKQIAELEEKIRTVRKV